MKPEHKKAEKARHTKQIKHTQANALECEVDAGHTQQGQVRVCSQHGFTVLAILVLKCCTVLGVEVQVQQEIALLALLCTCVHSVNVSEITQPPSACNTLLFCFLQVCTPPVLSMHSCKHTFSIISPFPLFHKLIR